MYPGLSKAGNKEREAEISKYWQSIDLLHQSVETREGRESFVFYDGPPTANGKPGLHHVVARGLKDSICRYKTMKGYQVKRKAGWDTHGLPVEIEVEKKLKLSNKQDIEKYGLEAFNAQCRESVFTYEAAWREMTERMAFLVDMDDPYVTLENRYIESVWWILDKFFKEGYIYEGHKILPYCARCGTGLASHEVSLGYQEIKTDTVYVTFKLKNEEAYFLVWTTTPWTLASNVALTVHPGVTYVRAKQGDKVYILAKKLLHEVMGEDYEILDEFLGETLERVPYEPIMPFVQLDKEAHFVTLGDYVTTDDGTGIVHTAPAFGEDDYHTGRRYDLPVPQPVDEDGKYTQTPWKGQFVIDADPEIIQWLKSEGKLYRKQKIEHNYPHCWRCKTPLLYSAKPSWYIEMTRLKDQLIANNNAVHWHPDYVGEKRFGNWLENLNDWAISRNRYWGTPLNIWRCECGHTTSIASIAELTEKAIESIDDTIELHRPYVDDVHIRCEQCGGVMSRVPEVIDVWFDSGAMPFAQHHYPFENKENFDKLFPADFICEGIDQTRGWFYSLIAISTFVMGQSPYKNVLVNDLLLDKEGKKMSKSRGNVLDAAQLFDKYGVDAVRWYLNYVSPAWAPTKFDEEGLKEVKSKFFNTLENVYNFFILYANIDKVDARKITVPVGDRPELDRWIVSRLNTLIQDVTQDFDDYDLTKSVRKIQEFVSEDLSNWYIRRSRRRFWNPQMDRDKESVYRTTYEVLLEVSKIIAAIAPYLSEEIYRNLSGETSVHLADFPQADPAFIDATIEKRMELVRALVTLGRAARESVKIKVRQPVQKVLVDGAYKALIEDLTPLIREELNVKSVVFVDDVKDYMDFNLKPNFRVLGPLLGKDMGAFGKALESLDAKETVAALERGETIEVSLPGGLKVAVDSEKVQVNITSKEGFTVEMENNVFIILDTTLSEALIREGYAREFVSRIQQIRKAMDFEVSDHIEIHYSSTEAFTQAIEEYEDYVLGETLGTCIRPLENADAEEYDLNGQPTRIQLKRIRA